MARINGVDIESVQFAPGQITVTFAEDRDIDSPSGIMEIRTLVVPSEIVESAAEEMLDAIQQFIDLAYTAKRNPRAVIRR